MSETEAQSNNVSVKFRGKAMAKLTAARRDNLPKSEFAGPGRRYPINDKSHAKNAKGRAKQMLKRGVISQSEYSKIVAKANRKLGE